MRGAPQRIFFRLIRFIREHSSALMDGRPTRPRDFQRQ